MQKSSYWKIPLILLIGLFLASGCSSITDFMQEDMRGPSWDTNLRLPLIPTHEIKLVDILNENEEEFDDEDIFSFEFELDKMDFGLDDIEIEDIVFDPIETTLPEIEVDLGRVFSGELDPFVLVEGQDITLDADIPTLDLSEEFSSLTIAQGTLDFDLEVHDPEDEALEFDIEIILLDDNDEIARGEAVFKNGEAQVSIDLAGETLPSEIDVEFEIKNPSKDYTGKLTYSAEMDGIKVEKVTDLNQTIDILGSLTITLDSGEFDDNIKKIVMEEGFLNISPSIPGDWNITFSIEQVTIDGQELPGGVSLEEIEFDLDDDIEVAIDYRVEGSDISYDTNEEVGFSASLTDLLWKEITVVDLLDDMEDFIIEEEIIETGLDELEEWLEGIGLAEEAITLVLQVENETGFEITSDLALILLYTHNDTEGESKIETADFNIGPRETKDVLFTSEEIPSMPHSIKIPRSSLEFSVPGNEVTISRADFVSAAGKADFKLKFLVQPGGIINDVATGELELDTDDQDVLSGWIQNILIDFHNTNNLPLYLDITVFFSNDEDNIFDEDNPNWTIGLPETGTSENYLVEVSPEDVEIFQEPAWYGIRVEILKDVEEATEIIFKYGDSFSTRANLDVEVRVNPHED